MTKASFLFLDRDGVINQRLPHRYVERPEQFEFVDGVLEVFPLLTKKFQRIFVVTNQQGIGKGIMSHADLEKIHEKMLLEILKAGGKVDAIRYSPDLVSQVSNTRKPHPHMAMQIKQDFPEVDFKQSIMVGDSVSDMLFGKRLNMETVMITSNADEVKKASMLFVDRFYDSLSEFSRYL